MRTPTFGPVSAALEADVRSAVRAHGVVVWLDADGSYTDFVDRLTTLRATDPAAVPYAVHAFRGSHLRLMLAVEGAAAGVDRTPLLVHLPGHNEETVRSTPLYELYASGVRYRKALDTLVAEAAAGRVAPERIAELRTGTFSLDRADAWLSNAVADRGGLGEQLRALTPGAVLDDLLAGGLLAGSLGNAADRATLWEQLASWTGIPEAWRVAFLPGDSRTPRDIAFTAASWALAVEYVHDLRRPPVEASLAPAVGLAAPLVATCRSLCDHLRRTHDAFYQRTADETEASLEDEVRAAKAQDLGRIDTFRFEEDRVLSAALDALAEDDWQAVLSWSDPRVDGGTFWLARDPARRSAWQLVQGAARLGSAIRDAGASLAARDGLEAGLERYVRNGAAVDQAHRHLEQRRATLLFPQLPEFERLRAQLDELRSAWRTWADDWARDWSAACRAHGFLPPAPLQQRGIFDEVVRPAVEEGLTAYFVVDAFRYEMGEELSRTLEETPLTTVTLRARLAELPTVTEVGMNVLAPVADRGRLRPVVSDGAIKGFSTGEFRVGNIESRQRAKHDRVGGERCPWLTLEEVTAADTTTLKQKIARAKLVVVHSQEIDQAGEHGVGPAVFDFVMQKLRAAWRLLREAGVRRFVFTADHGFLLSDELRTSGQPHGRKVDPKRRHVLSPVAADHTGEARVPLAALAYDGVDGHLMFPESTAVFDTGRRPMGFVHGGNSLQERVIPVLAVVHRVATGGATVRYSVVATAMEDVAGMHCIEGTVDVATQAQGALAFGGAREVELALRVVDAADVNVVLAQARGDSRLVAGAIRARVGKRFEVFFRLDGPEGTRVRVEVWHPSADAEVAPCVVDARFSVTGRRPTAAGVQVLGGLGWLTELPDGVRDVFAHLAAHGAVTESEAIGMLGDARALRRFSLKFEEWAAKAPFGVRIEVVGGSKRYMREGR